MFCVSCLFVSLGLRWPSLIIHAEWSYVNMKECYAECNCMSIQLSQGLYFTTYIPGGSARKASACPAGDPDSIPGSGRSPGEGNSNPLRYSCLENPMDGGAWWATVHGVAKSRTRLSDFTSVLYTVGFPGGSAGKESGCNVGDLGLIAGLGRSPGEGKGYPLQYSCLENPMDRGGPGGLQSMGSHKKVVRFDVT